MTHTDVASVTTVFGDRLHRAGLATTPERSARFAQILDLVRPAAVADLYWAARVAFVIDRADVDLFDRVFAEVFRGMVDVGDVTRNPNVADLQSATSKGADRPPQHAAESGRSSADHQPPVPTRATDGGDDAAEANCEGLLAAASSDELLRDKAFGACTPEELVMLGGLLARLRLVPPRRPSRRTRQHAHGSDVHWRSTLRAARRTGGDPVELVRRRQRSKPRRVVLLADVSASMEDYSRAYLYLLHGAVRSLRAEAFVFSTRLTRLTRPLAEVNPNVALARATRTAADWSGGTRIGEALRVFNDRWSRRGLTRGAVVVIVSDGWDAGEPALVAREMERLSRLAYRIVWVNPRRQSSSFQPRAGGMAAALPFIDAFVSGHSLAALDDVLAAISQPTM